MNTTEQLETIDLLKAQLDHLCRRIGAETYADAVDALETLRQRAHRFANDVYARDLIMSQIKRQLGCADLVGIPEAIAKKLAQIDNLEMAQSKLFDHAKKLVNYHMAGRTDRTPEFVPSRVLVLKETFGDPPFHGAGVSAGECDCFSNKYGAVSVLDRGGKKLGLRLNEFDILEWRANTIQAAMEKSRAQLVGIIGEEAAPCPV